MHNALNDEFDGYHLPNGEIIIERSQIVVKSYKKLCYIIKNYCIGFKMITRKLEICRTFIYWKTNKKLLLGSNFGRLRKSIFQYYKGREEPSCLLSTLFVSYYKRDSYQIQHKTHYWKLMSPTQIFRTCGYFQIIKLKRRRRLPDDCQLSNLRFYWSFWHGTEY